MGYDLRGRRALVTGASSGIGREIARELAARGCGSIVLAARRRDRLDELKAELGHERDVMIDVVTCDLAHETGARELIDAVEALGRPIDVLVNSAGVGIHGHGFEHEWESERAMLMLNVVALAELTKHFGRAMKARESGRILQIASNAAFQPCPGYAAYGATKSFVLHHAEALAEELRATDVRITALCPGSTNTEFFEVSGNVRSRVQVATSLEPDVVARVGVDAIVRGARTVVPGLANRLAAAGLRVIPRRLQATLARRVLE